MAEQEASVHLPPWRHRLKNNKQIKCLCQKPKQTVKRSLHPRQGWYQQLKSPGRTFITLSTLLHQSLSPLAGTFGRKPSSPAFYLGRETCRRYALIHPSIYKNDARLGVWEQRGSTMHKSLQYYRHTLGRAPVSRFTTAQRGCKITHRHRGKKLLNRNRETSSSRLHAQAQEDAYPECVEWRKSYVFESRLQSLERWMILEMPKFQ